MNKTLARLFFVLVPALLAGAVMALLHWMIGLVTLMVALGIGLDVTEPRFDRGERR